jgi:hypothetical protein
MNLGESIDLDKIRTERRTGKEFGRRSLENHDPAYGFRFDRISRDLNLS